MRSFSKVIRWASLATPAGVFVKTGRVDWKGARRRARRRGEPRVRMYSNAPVRRGSEAAVVMLEAIVPAMVDLLLLMERPRDMVGGLGVGFGGFVGVCRDHAMGRFVQLGSLKEKTEA